MKNISDLTMQCCFETIEAMKGVSVLVIGDIMLDRFVYGKVDRISPESPVPVLSVQRENKMLGGAGNTLSNLCNLECHAHIISVVGDDEQGREIKDILASWSVDNADILMASDRPTIVKTRFLAGHQQLLRTDYEQIKPVSNDVEQLIIEAAKKRIHNVGAVIISDYGKGMLSKGVLKEIIKIANGANIPVLVDPKGVDYSIYKGADYVTPNKKELSESTRGMSVDTDDGILNACRALINQSGISAVIATRSQDGMSIVSKDDITHIRSANNIEVFDVSGAGDTVIATIAASLAAGGDIVTAASLANAAGSVVVSKVGTAPIRSTELRDFIEEHGLQNKSKKGEPNSNRMRSAPISTWEEAKEEILRWKARGLKVGFTNGCFDILHFGHVTYLNDARERCDRLVLGLNKDASIRILKGEERPVHDERSRANVLAALGSVDMVVLFGAEKSGDDNTACALLDMLHPDIYFKGGDYAIDQIPEAPTVHKNGGVVDVMPVYDGHSTTNSIKKMKGDPKAA
ncbi:MAG: D-glycero-beta-D-manno-heptose-7-phosphate kinase [Alphaproteobacteria bacterium]